MQTLLVKQRKFSFVKTAGWVLPLAVFFPFLVHLIPPQNGIPIGAHLIPMFYIPFVALVWYRLPLALVIAAFAPIINFLLTGNPQWGFLAVLTLELLVFTFVANGLLKTKMQWVTAPVSYLGAKTVSSLLLVFVPLLPAEPLDFMLASVTNAVPGLIVLLIINVLVLRFKQSRNPTHAS